MEAKVRTFVAIELPEIIQRDIRHLQHAFKSHRFDIRWVKPLNMHLTLAFLGNISPSVIEAVGRVVSETATAHPVFELIPQGVGVFPNIRRPRIIWAGISGQTDILRSLQAFMSSGLNRLGFKTEKRPYKGHLTLGRVKSPLDQGRLVDALRSHQGFVSRAFSVQHLVMFKSELHPGGPFYTKLSEVPLGHSNV
jgi:RNA 2',3'-cyclic 3'-phosphodiesterase